MKEFVLITGATNGIGYEIAKIFAANKANLILVGRNQAKLEGVKKKLSKNSEIYTLCADLSKEESAKWIYEETCKLQGEVSIVINNAGAGYVGEFVEATDEKIMQLMTLNMTTLTLLTKYYAKDMMANRKGKILNVASTGAYHPGPYTALYYATKAYVFSLTQALTEELRPYGVVVCSLCPGATATGFAKAAGRENTNIAMPAHVVAKKAYQDLMKNKRLSIPGIQNKLFVKIPRFIAIKLIKNYQRALKNK